MLALFLFACGGPSSSEGESERGREGESGSEGASVEKLTIAAAANMQFAMDSIVAAFSRETSIPCDVIIGSSGKLTAQITEGAPYDVFVSANMTYPNAIYKKGLALDTPVVYAYGRLVLWSLANGLVPSLEVLVKPEIEHIAIANPELAPYGIAAMQALKYYQLADKVEGKLVYGESIAQTNQFIVSRSADIGFTAMSVVLSPQMENSGKWVEIDRDAYQPIAQGIVLIQRKDSVKKEALEFYKFLLSPPAQKILSNFGYHELGPADTDL